MPKETHIYHPLPNGGGVWKKPMTKQKITEPMPRWWWLNPWTFAIGQWEARNRHYAKYLEFSKAYGEVNVELFNLKKEMQWQTIETAPKDNKTWVLVCEYGYVYVAIFDKEGFCHTDERIGLDPTHWMPLPKPPTL